MQTDGWVEIVPWEIGKNYITTRDIVVEWNGHKLTIRKGFPHDKYTFAPNLSDVLPAIAHDFAYTYKVWDDGSPISKAEADAVLRDLMLKSKDKWARRLAWIYYIGVRMAVWNGW